jgi:hypothetical protein
MWNRLLLALRIRKAPLPADPFGEPAPLDLPNSVEFDATYKQAASAHWFTR